MVLQTSILSVKDYPPFPSGTYRVYQDSVKTALGISDCLSKPGLPSILGAKKLVGKENCKGSPACFHCFGLGRETTTTKVSGSQGFQSISQLLEKNPPGTSGSLSFPIPENNLKKAPGLQVASPSPLPTTLRNRKICNYICNAVKTHFEGLVAIEKLTRKFSRFKPEEGFSGGRIKR